MMTDHSNTLNIVPAHESVSFLLPLRSMHVQYHSVLCRGGHIERTW